MNVQKIDFPLFIIDFKAFVLVHELYHTGFTGESEVACGVIRTKLKELEKIKNLPFCELQALEWYCYVRYETLFELKLSHKGRNLPDNSLKNLPLKNFDFSHVF